jgi:hypothetical protein
MHGGEQNTVHRSRYRNITGHDRTFLYSTNTRTGNRSLYLPITLRRSRERAVCILTVYGTVPVRTVQYGLRYGTSIDHCARTPKRARIGPGPNDADDPVEIIENAQTSVYSHGHIALQKQKAHTDNSFVFGGGK